MDIKKKLGRRIRKIRIEHFLTQEMLAEKLELSSKALSQIEIGNNFSSYLRTIMQCSGYNA